MSKVVDKIWEDINTPVLNNIKVHLLQYHVSDILRFYTVKVDYVVSKYAKYLPNYVVESEIDDLKTVAKLELLETLKVWDPGKGEDIWPLAQQRIIGAMKDHIRYITKSDPSRFYEWVSDAAYFYQAVKDRADFATEIENGMELNEALKVLEYRERKIIIMYTKKDMTFKEIGLKLDVSESQISRIYKRAIDKLKKYFAE